MIRFTLVLYVTVNNICIGPMSTSLGSFELHDIMRKLKHGSLIFGTSQFANSTWQATWRSAQGRTHKLESETHNQQRGIYNT